MSPMPSDWYQDAIFYEVHGKATILVVANLDLSRHRGAVATELLAETRFRPVGESPHFLSFGPHGFCWFRLEPRDRRPPRYGIEDTAI